MAVLKKIEAKYDLWDSDSNKLLCVKTTSALKKNNLYVPSLLPAVKVPVEGVSYNPSLESYNEYVKRIESEEKQDLKNEKKIECELKLASSAKLSTNSFYGENFDFKNEKNISNSNLQISDTKTNQETNDNEDENQDSKPKKFKRKTQKQRRNALLRYLKDKRKLKLNVSKKIEQQLLNLKALNKSIKKEAIEHEKLLSERKKKRALNCFLKKKRLGRGQLDKFVEPVLLVDEITGSLRTVVQQTNVLQERLHSFKERNIIPTTGNAKKSTKKLSLSIKFVEKRDVRCIEKGTHLI